MAHVHALISERVVVRRGVRVPVDELPEDFAALDGYAVGSHIDNQRRRYSFDHHDGVVRFCTRATCEQVLDAVLLGLDLSSLRLGVNDLDMDVVLSVTIALFPQVCREPWLETTRRLARLVGAADAHGPAYPVEDPTLLRQFSSHVLEGRSKQAWASGDLGAHLAGTVTRALAFIRGERSRVAVGDRKFTVFAEDAQRGTIMVESADPVLDLAYDIHPRVVAFNRLPDGSTAYTIAKRSDFVDRFPIRTMVAQLNQEELGSGGSPDALWGGATTIAGAPRHGDGSRSRLSPATVWQIVQDSCPLDAVPS